MTPESEWPAYINGLIGKPYHVAKFNCWHLVQKVQRDLAGRSLALPSRKALVAAMKGKTSWGAIKALESSERMRWRVVEHPSALDVVLAAPVQGEAHAGVYFPLDGGCVLHCDCDFGVVWDDVPGFRAGFRDLRWYTPS